MNPYIVLAIFSAAMFSAPFVVYFFLNYLLSRYTHISGFQETVLILIATLLTVFIIIAIYVYIAFKFDTSDEIEQEDNDAKDADKKHD